MKLIKKTTSSKKSYYTLVLSFMGWCVVCIGFNNFSNSDLFLQKAHAQDMSITQKRISNGVLSGEALGDFLPYEPEAGNIMARSQEFYKSENGQYAAGIWEGKPGSMTINDAPYAEVMYIMEGSMMMGSSDKDPITYKAGEGVVMPKGWSGRFAVPDGGVRMIWSTYTNETLPVGNSTDLVLLDRDTLDGLRFSDFRPFDADVSDIIARDHEFYRTSDDKFGVDVWEAQPGQVPFADLGYDEMIYVLDGNMSFVNSNGDAQIYGPGKALILPKGWTGTGVVSTNGARLILFWHRNIR